VSVPHLDAAEINELHARVCKALADPTRLLIINDLRNGPRSVGEIAEAVEISQPNASRHLALLRDRGIVTTQRAGSNIFYDLTSPKIVRAVDLLREFMSEVLGWRPSADSLLAEPAMAPGAGEHTPTTR
jgi:DNA-binding transcriptional ArsR family regulator